MQPSTRPGAAWCRSSSSSAAGVRMCMGATRDGGGALKLATRLVGDVILLDIGLTGIDGYEAARGNRRLPSLSKTRLIAMTGYGQDSDKRTAFEAGFDGHLVKPVDYAE